MSKIKKMLLFVCVFSLSGYLYSEDTPQSIKAGWKLKDTLKLSTSELEDLKSNYANFEKAKAKGAPAKEERAALDKTVGSLLSEITKDLEVLGDNVLAFSNANGLILYFSKKEKDKFLFSKVTVEHVSKEDKITGDKVTYQLATFNVRDIQNLHEARLVLGKSISELEKKAGEVFKKEGPEKAAELLSKEAQSKVKTFRETLIKEKVFESLVKGMSDFGVTEKSKIDIGIDQSEQLEFTFFGVNAEGETKASILVFNFDVLVNKDKKEELAGIEGTITILKAEGEDVKKMLKEMKTLEEHKK